MLHVAASAGQLKAVQYLVQQGVNVFAKDSIAYTGGVVELTASQRAFDKYGRKNPVYMFLREKELALMQEVILNGNESELDNLIDNGADLTIRDAKGESMAHFAARNGRTEALNLMEVSFGKDAVYSDDASKNLAQQTPLDVLVIRGRFFDYEDGQYKIAKDKKGRAKRPGNQSVFGTLQRTAQRLENLVNNDTRYQLTPLQTRFVSKVNTVAKARQIRGKNKNKEIKLKPMGIDIAHNVAISVIMEATVARMNSPLSGNDDAAINFVNAMISSDDDDAIGKAETFYNDLGDEETLPQDKIAKADETINRLNMASANLIPGHNSTNKSVHEKRDPHLLKLKAGDQEFSEHKRARRIAVTGRKFIAKTGETYRPHVRDAEDGDKEAKSSSVHRIPDQAWFPYESPKSADLVSPVFDPGYDSDGDAGSEAEAPTPRQASPARYTGSIFGKLNTSRATIKEEADEEELDEEQQEESDEESDNNKSKAKNYK